MNVGQRGIYFEGAQYAGAPCVVTKVHDQTLFPKQVNCVAFVDGENARIEGWADEDAANLAVWRTNVKVLQPGDPRTYPCIVDLV
jgi:hypothetical protein